MNIQRGHVAEYLIAMALGIVEQKRVERKAYDLVYQGNSIEVKMLHMFKAGSRARIQR